MDALSLSRVALRSTAHLSNDRSAPRVGIDQVHIERDQNAHENSFLELGMDRWLLHVEELSFETTSVPLSMAEARLLRQAYAHLHGRSYYEDTALPTSPSLSPELVAALAELGDRLWPAMKALGAEQEGVFGKLSGRSAKDAPLYTSRLDKSLAKQFSARGADDDNTKLHSLFDAALELMRLHDAASLLWMLINSQRVDEDLDVALRHPERWDQAIVIRRWWDGVTSDLEFRMFVVEGNPTGLTQYNQFIHSPRIAAHGEAIANALYDFYQAEVLPRLRSTPFFEAVQGRFTCDLALHPEALGVLEGRGRSTGATGACDAPKLTREHVKLIELNCFYEATGMGLFDYHADKQRLDAGPFEWRVRTEPMPHGTVRLENEWRDLLRQIGTVKTTGVSPRRLTDDAYAQLTKATSKMSHGYFTTDHAVCSELSLV